jgi:hypothetical protein
LGIGSEKAGRAPLIGLLEKLNFVLALLTVLFVGGSVTLFSIVPRSSGIDNVMVNSELATMDWLDAQRRVKAGRPPAKVEEWIDLSSQPAAPRQQVPPPSDTSQEAKKQRAEALNRYFESDSEIPRNEQVPGIPFLRRVPGVQKYAKPKAVPQILYKKYQSFQDTWDLVQEGGGEFVETDSGTAYQVNWIQDSSYLYSKIGLRPGDRVISVNGQPVGQSVAAGKAMYDQLKGEKRFAVLIERNGQKMVLSYYVQ